MTFQEYEKLPLDRKMETLNKINKGEIIIKKEDEEFLKGFKKMFN